MADDPNEEVKNEVYYNNKQYTSLFYDYDRGYLRATEDQPSLLLSAKACFLKQKYEDCKKLLKRIRLDHNTKTLFQRQALMFKTSYLLEPQNMEQLENIVREYDRFKTRCPGKPLNDFHNNTMRELLDFVIKGKQYKLKAFQINKQQFRDRIKAEQKRTKYEGLPSFLISAGWNKKFNQFLLKSGPHPGPIANFQIINHIVQLQPHEQPSKDYMDKLLFPVIEESNYFVVNHRHWKMLQQIFWGYPIKRVFTIDPKNRQISGGDHLIKTLIEYENNKIVMQWQQGTFWDKSVLPILMNKFGTGQLKEQTRNKDFLIVRPGRIEQPTTRLKYIKVDTNLIKASSNLQEERKKKILSNYDLQKYNPDQYLPKGTVGLANLGNTCYMNAALQSLANLKMLSNYLLANRYLVKLNIGETNKDGSYGEVTCAYADLVKRMWFSPKDTRYIDPTLFKKVFAERYSIFDGYEQQDAQQFLMFLLNCMHEDLNQYGQLSLAHRESMTGKAFDSVLKTAVTHYNRHNKSIISELFHGFNYQQIKCDHCEFTTYRFEHNLMLHLQVPPQAPKITVFLVEINNFKEAKRVDVYIKNLQTLDQIFAVMRKHFNTSPQNQYIPFLYSDEPKDWEDLQNDDGIKYVIKQQDKGGFVFVFEVRKPQPDQQIIMLSYFHQSKIKGLQCDGFPRILAAKKSFKDKQFEEELQDLIFSTIPKQKIQRDKKQYIKEIKHKKIKDKAYASEYKVYFNQKVSNFSNTLIPKVLGQSGIEDTINLEGVLQKMRKKQIIDENEKWYCDKCKCVRSAHKTDKIYSTGKYLIIQFKRFTEKGKITTKIQYPINNLNMKPYITAEKGRFESSVYNLQGVILHRGSLNSGHYTSLCRTSDKSAWLNFDDESVREVEQSQVVDCNAYILLYERIDDNQSYISVSNSNL